MKLKWPAKLIIIGALLAAGWFGVKRFAPDMLATVFPASATREAAVPLKANLPAAPVATPNAPAPVDSDRFPQLSALDLQPGCADLPEVRWGGWFWNTHMGLLAANGGPQAAKGSKMCAKGVNLKYVREDDVGRQREGLVKFAQQYQGGTEFPTDGFAFISLMGDGTAAILTEANAILERLGIEYRAQVVGSGGYSRGEDCLMGPPAWKSDPQRSRGGLCAAYLRDGDWDIGMKWLGDNELCNNPDEKTYDPGCMNWVNAETYIDAAQKYVAGYCEDRPVVRNGKRTGETKRVCVDCAATWTPGDKIVADQRGGLVKVASTKEYAYQMPMAIIGIRKWMQAHPALVEGMLEAMLEANEEIVRDDTAMRRAAALSAVVYHEQGADASYVYRYFFGKTERDKTGLAVEIGGSSVSNLADNCQLFGIQSCAPGSTSIYRATYETFGDIVVQQYPDLVPRYQPYEHVVDPSFIERIATRRKPTAKPDLPQFAETQPVTSIVSRKAWHINFASGKATFSNGAESQLKKLRNDLVIAGGAAVEVHGHTDNVGNPDANQALSEARAFAVKKHLESKAAAHFSKGRVRVFAHGQEQPVEENSTSEGRAANRRVEVVLGTIK